MAKTSSDASPSHDSTVEIDLKDRRLAAFLAWLIPGAGHIYQGRTGKGVLFFVCILGTFFYGLHIGYGRVVYASTANVFSRPAQVGDAGRMGWAKFITDRWQYVCQLGVGLPALPALVQRQRVRSGKEPLWGGFMRPPYDVPPADQPGGFESKDLTDPKHTVKHPDELAKWNYDYGEFFEIGTVFTVIAGLLNVLAIYDAYGGPLIIPPPEDTKKKT
jgi:hypothetical protein